MKKYSYILWDLDGTLIYSHPGIYACIEYALEKMGLPAPKKEQLEKCIGPSLTHSYTVYFGLSDEDAERATVLFQERYTAKGVYENAPIEGTVGCLEGLQKGGFVMALATSKPLVYADLIVKRWGYAPYLKEIVGPGMEEGLSTKADVIAEAMKRLGANKEECLMVGDRIYDLEGARENGVDCALLRVGYAPEGELDTCGADYVFDDIEDLTAFLLQNAETNN